ncbi:antirestriction protein ArdA [Gordonia sp. 852002-50395_SCH5434458]|uniref:antirestriction protein ArdA n=1 Tax=Gordonia sp. 852002-50395_SCH5434458 TaxID=1834090 RepID=UPI0007EAA44E|nr:antirestriction protein ArdA [Gordonia sp. 852002-50395_SCH5434458]OBC02712.1 hypothetical protein A5785_02555 [Gordonia sp. 852002-50395_SCH5434458]
MSTDSWIDQQIAEGVLSPGARGMTPQAAADQYNAANVLVPTDPGYLVPSADGQAEEHHRSTDQLRAECVGIDEIPGDVELDPQAVARWRDLYEQVGAEHWPVFCAWVRSGACVEDSDGMPSASEFHMSYHGTWPRFRNYADALFEVIGLLDPVPKGLRPYVDIDRVTGDLERNYVVVPAPNGGVYVFNRVRLI